MDSVGTLSMDEIKFKEVCDEEVVDLLVPAGQARHRLDIKKDWKGVATVFGAQSIAVASR